MLAPFRSLRVSPSTAPADSATPTDVELLRFAQGMEIALGRAYQAASPLLTSTSAIQSAGAFTRHHAGHAAAFAGLAGGGALIQANRAMLAEMLGAVQSAKTENDALAVLYELEDKAAATHQYLIEHLLGDDAIHMVASVLPVEGQHAVIIGTLIQKALVDLTPAFQKVGGHYDPSRFPVP